MRELNFCEVGAVAGGESNDGYFAAQELLGLSPTYGAAVSSNSTGGSGGNYSFGSPTLSGDQTASLGCNIVGGVVGGVVGARFGGAAGGIAGALATGMCERATGETAAG